MVELLIAIVATVVGGLLLRWFSSEKFREISGRVTSVELSPSKAKKIIYISAGGTCRDPMAAAVTKNIIDINNLSLKIKIEGMALGPISKKTVSFAARKAIEKLTKKDLLGNHIPKTISKTDIETADLILVMDKSLLNYKILPRDKTYLLKEFFGEKGDIDDPWPDGRDDLTLNRYYKTAYELNEIISKNIDLLLNAIK